MLGLVTSRGRTGEALCCVAVPLGLIDLIDPQIAKSNFEGAGCILEPIEGCNFSCPRCNIPIQRLRGGKL